MAHFAQLDENNIVQQVIVVNNNVLINSNTGLEDELIGINFCKSLYGENTKWVQTSYNKTFRKNYAGIGMLWLPNGPDGPGFAPPQPYPSWILNSFSYYWEPPVPMPVPNNPPYYVWDEATQGWIEEPAP